MYDWLITVEKCHWEKLMQHLHKPLDKYQKPEQVQNCYEKNIGFAFVSIPAPGHTYTPTRGLTHACQTDHLDERVNKRFYSLDAHPNLLQQELSVPGSSYRDQ